MDHQSRKVFSRQASESRENDPQTFDHNPLEHPLNKEDEDKKQLILSSVTKFGEILSLWQNLKKFRQIFKDILYLAKF